MNSFKIKSKSEKETLKIGQILSENLKGLELILLIGELGAGKTTFTQGILKGLGYKGWGRSPTFVLINEYSLIHNVKHMDFYRLNDISELINLGIEEYLDDDSIKIIEWPEIGMDLYGNNHILITITKINKIEREVEIKFNNINNSYIINNL